MTWVGRFEILLMMDNQELNPPLTQTTSGSKLFYVLIVVVVLVLGGIGGYLLGTKVSLTPMPTIVPKAINNYPLATTSDETAGWKTYTNTKYSYSVKYPANFEVKEQESDIFLFQSSFESTDNKEKTWEDFMVEVTKKTGADGELGVVDYRKWQVIGHISDKISKETKIKIDRFDGVRLDYEIISTPVVEQATVILFGENYNYSLIGDRKLVDLALSTFKFLPQISPAVTDETANWKLYINNKYGFQLKYPSQWYSCNLNKEDNLFLLDQQNKICDENGVMPPGDRSYPIHVYVETGIKNKAEFISSWQKNNFKATPQSNLNLPLNSTSYSLEKIQAAPGPDGMVMILTPLKGNTIIIQVNDLSLTNDAYQILSTFRFF